MIYKKTTRRMFLQGSSGALLAIPFLESLIPRVARAATVQPIKRYIAVTSTFDYGSHQNLYPSLARPANLLSVPGHHPMYYQSLASYMLDGRKQLSRIVVPELTPYLSQLNMFRALDHTSWFGHGYGQILGNLADSSNNPDLGNLPDVATIDHVLRRNKNFNTIDKDVIILGNSSRTYSWGPDAAGKIVNKGRQAKDSLTAFNQLFKNGTLPESGGGPPPKHPRVDVLSRVLDDYLRVSKGAQISSVDKLVLDNALDQLSDVQRGIAQVAVVGASCKYKGSPTDKTGVNMFYDLSGPAQADPTLNKYKLTNYANLIAAAMACDVGRIFVFQGDVSDGYKQPIDASLHQDVSHSPFRIYNGLANWELMGNIQADYMKYFVAPLVKAMDSLIDPANGKSFLYNSLVHYGTEHSTVHQWASASCLLFGSAGGAISTGNYLDYSDTAKAKRREDSFTATVPGDPKYSPSYPGIPYNRILVTIMQALGLTPQDYEDPNLNKNWLNRTDGRYGKMHDGITHIGGYGYISTPNPELNAYPVSTYYNQYALMNFNYWKDPVPLPIG